MQENPDLPVIIPQPTFDHDDYVDRGYYIVIEFQDEKRRRDRAKAVEAAREHDSYVCLMTPDNRLLHRCVFTRRDIHKFIDLQSLVSTWSSPRYYLMGYPIEAADLMRGLECYGKMGPTCNRLIDEDEAPFPSYFGCPRASISLKYKHPRAWYAVFYERDQAADHRFEKAERLPLPQNPDDGAEAEKGTPQQELERICHDYCGCPLVHARWTRQLFERLPQVIEINELFWRIAPDMMNEPSLQPAGEEQYYNLLEELACKLPCSDAPDVAPPDVAPPDVAPNDEVDNKVDDDEQVDAATQRRQMLSRFTWLED